MAAWQGGDPVYVSPESGALGDEDANGCGTGSPAGATTSSWRCSCGGDPGRGSRRGRGLGAARRAVRRHGRVDGIYVVNFSGAGTYAAGYGDAPGAFEVGRIVAEQVQDHTLGQVDQILDGTLDELGAPDGGGVSALWVSWP